MAIKPLSKSKQRVVQDESDATVRDDARLADQASAGAVDERCRKAVEDDYNAAPMDFKGGFWKKTRAWISSCFH